MELFAAVDIMGGQAVRLVKGEFAAPSGFGDPLEVADKFLAGGASWLHVVDLDAARTGERVNRTVVRSLVDEAHRAGARVEVGGGVRSDAALESLLTDGADRVVLGTAAIEDPGLAAELATRRPGRVAVGFDYRRATDGTFELALRGWGERSPVDPSELVAAWSDAPIAAVVATAIDRDGTREGPDADGLSWLLDATVIDVVASGGVGGAAHLTALARLRSPVRGRSLAGVVVGRALVDGSMDVEEAVEACAASA
ncbi:MAG TPA: 1-(5-phosphoribosyl)-5-[(5-phosphoribosylamino)methylideneamino] imidazole-4-carboxamide isomerase [Acidimicrobiales bacterium]|nr:1-(5-phosphoribosyl)-5-[(5-phosphoribosylamino)methylideneamino] imidazole-4-carboxamide isomerase [Acidimicrobiales bacterium]